MPSVADTIWISLGLKTAEFSQALSKAQDGVKKASSELAKGADQVASKAVGQLAGIARMVAAPLAGAMSIGAMIKSYFGGVAQVAEMTGAYSSKLDEWRKKRALLSRVTQEDIQLYKKYREALTKFQIAMADVSAKIMRQTSPAIQFLTNILEKVSDWVEAHSDDLVRFITVLAGVIGVMLLPKLAAMAAALLMNPITWMVAALIGLAAVIDDLIVWLQGGESALDSFWSQFGSREEVLKKIQNAIQVTIEVFKSLWESIKSGFKAAIVWLDEFWTSCSGTDRVLDALSEAFNAVKQTIKDVGVIWEHVSALLSDNGFLDDLKVAFDGALKFVLGLFRFFFDSLQVIAGLIKGLLTGDWGSFTDAVKKAVDSAKDIFEGFWQAIKAIFNQIWELAKDVFTMIGEAIKNAFDFSGWGEKLNPMNWFGSGDDKQKDPKNAQAIANQQNPQLGNSSQPKPDVSDWFKSYQDAQKGNNSQPSTEVPYLPRAEDNKQDPQQQIEIKPQFKTEVPDWDKYRENAQLWEKGKQPSSDVPDWFKSYKGAQNRQEPQQQNETKAQPKSNVSNWFKSHADWFKPREETQEGSGTQQQTDPSSNWLQSHSNWFKPRDDAQKGKETQPKFIFSNLQQVPSSGLEAERSIINNSASNSRTTIDSHATLNINTNNPAVAGVAIEQVVPSTNSTSYVDQSALAIS